MAMSMGAVDYIPVPVVPDLLRARCEFFAELYRKTGSSSCSNEDRRAARCTSARPHWKRSTARACVRERAAPLHGARPPARWVPGTGISSTGDNGTWDDFWPVPHLRDRARSTPPTSASFYGFIHPDDLDGFRAEFQKMSQESAAQQFQFRYSPRRRHHPLASDERCSHSRSDDRSARIRRRHIRYHASARKTSNAQSLHAREVDHRAKNALAMVQAVLYE